MTEKATDVNELNGNSELSSKACCSSTQLPISIRYFSSRRDWGISIKGVFNYSRSKYLRNVNLVISHVQNCSQQQDTNDVSHAQFLLTQLCTCYVS